MPAQKLTKSFVNSTGPAGKDVIYWDAEVSGFGLKVTPSGSKTFVLQYRVAGVRNPQKLKIGSLGAFTVEEARKIARERLSEVQKGRNPQQEKKREARRKTETNYRELQNRFLKEHASHRKSGDQTRRILSREFEPQFGNLSVLDIMKTDIIAIIDGINDRPAPYMANRALAAIRKFFNWCVAKDYIASSPCAGIRASNREIQRDRVLSDAELRHVVLAARKIGYPYGSLVEFLTLTGQRREETASMRWEDVDLVARIWRIPSNITKNGKPHEVHLSSRALEILADARTRRIVVKSGHRSPFVFSSNGAVSFSGWSKAFKKLLKTASEIAAKEASNQKLSRETLTTQRPWVLHDLRRTMVTAMAANGVRHEVADLILNHKQGAISGVAAVYQRHEFLPERQMAMELWDQKIKQLLDAAEGNNVYLEGARNSGAGLRLTEDAKERA